MKRLIFLLLVLDTIPVSAQWLDRPWPNIPRTAEGAPDLEAPTPRTADGKPDFTGLWNGPPPVADLDPAILRPWVVELANERQRNFYKDRPFFRCLPNGPETENSGGWKRFVQTSDMLIILDDDLTHRVVHMDGRELEADPFPSWTGYSVGHWDGDTLVVESNGYNEETWVGRYGVSHTENLVVTERYTRTDFGHLQVGVMFSDPEAFTDDWGYGSVMTLAADTEMLELVCERTSDDWTGTVSGTEANRVDVPIETLQTYEGQYRGFYMGKFRTYEITVIDGELTAAVVGDYDAIGLGAAGLEKGVPRVLIPLSQTLFDGLGLGYRFIVNEAGDVESVHITHVSGDFVYTRLP
ncbi:MAG: hypothetical protein EBS81_10115 [Gammaproteobacteria bacterium]|nr:hypothetical protein [Gammaproteobacteria bacterium]